MTKRRMKENNSPIKWQKLEDEDTRGRKPRPSQEGGAETPGGWRRTNDPLVSSYGTSNCYNVWNKISTLCPKLDLFNLDNFPAQLFSSF